MFKVGDRKFLFLLRFQNKNKAPPSLKKQIEIKRRKCLEISIPSIKNIEQLEAVKRLLAPFELTLDALKSKVPDNFTITEQVAPCH